jgi:hypothetical protein
MYKDLSKSNIYENSNLSFEFEFMSPIRRRDMASKLSKILGKQVKWFKGVDESFKPNRECFKLSNKYSETSKSFILETGFLPYQEAMHIMLKTFNSIKNYGHTCDRCEMTVGIQLNEARIGLPVKLHKINKFKYFIGLNENEFLGEWGTVSTERQKLRHTKYSYIKAKDPYNTVISPSLIERMDPTVFSFPESEFFGHDFSKIEEGWVKISYIGGKEYELRKKQAVDTINSVINRLYETLNQNWEYNQDEKRKIYSLVEDYNQSLKNTRTYLNFVSNFPSIELYVDLKPTQYLLETEYPKFREKLLELVSFGEISEAKLNYDRDRGMIQIKDAKINKSIIIEGIEFYDCTIEADAKNCAFSGCLIKNSKLEECNILAGNQISNSKILECKYPGGNNEISNSYLDNSGSDMINADLKSCLVNRGTFKYLSGIDKDTVILNRG